MTMNMRLVFVGLCLVTSSWAKGDAPLALLAQNYAQMANVNIAYESTITSELTPYAIADFAKQNIAVEPQWQAKVTFYADKTGFNVQVSRLGKNANVSSFAYDGTTYQALHGWLSTLMVSKTNSHEPADLWDSDSLSMPAAILAKSQNPDGQIDSLWRDINNPAFWATLPTNFSPAAGGALSAVLNGKKLTVELADKNSPLVALGVSGVESYFGNSDKPALKYTCTEVGQISFQVDGRALAFAYPKKAIVQFYDETSGQLYKTEIHEITKIVVNDPQFDNSRFAIDPASVQRIYDTDSSTWISVPK